MGSELKKDYINKKYEIKVPKKDNDYLKKSNNYGTITNNDMIGTELFNHKTQQANNIKNSNNKNK
ncbi:MAG: hypothetical protein NC181_00220 [Clostridium sp.]|nr:hypothetical protein [Clostridium sp.]MCM1443899.1 hypothetical protein [Candidatus Amulumruptor caecigallinarius]